MSENVADDERKRLCGTVDRVSRKGIEKRIKNERERALAIPQDLMKI